MRKFITAAALLAAVGVIFFGARASDNGGDPTPVEQRPGIQGLDSGFEGSARPSMPPVDIELVDHRDQRLNETSLRGAVTVFAFMAPGCTGECPIVRDQVRGAFERLGDRARQVNVVAIPTAAPTSNEVEKLARWKGLDQQLRVAQGPKRGLQAALREFEVSLRSSERELAYVVLVDQRLRQRVAYVTHTLTPEALASDLTRLTAER